MEPMSWALTSRLEGVRMQLKQLTSAHPPSLHHSFIHPQAGQTKFKTAAVEYIRALGLAPTVIASSNHLGNNDMLNLTSKKTLDAKMRVKSDIFAGWEENIDHQVGRGASLLDR